VRCPARLAFLLEYPLRRRLLKLDHLVNRLPLTPDSRVLDLGAGSGVVARLILERDPDVPVVLADPQPAMLRRARRVMKGRGTFVTAPGESLPFADEEFHIVLMITVLGELDDPDRGLREVHRVMHPDATLVIAEHLPDLHFRPLDRLRRLVAPIGFAEHEVRGGRWSYTASFTKRPSPAMAGV
jgi:ubiquinone/menaquinone biosynthesis C-methylase UbiE